MIPLMPLIALLRGVNVGGHRTFRPSVLARELRDYDVVSVGAAGTFVVCKPVTRAKLRAELLKRLPFQTEVVLCDGRDLTRLAAANPFGDEPTNPGITRFVSVLAKAWRTHPVLPITFPLEGEWLLRLVAVHGQFVCGAYVRQMKAIGYLGQIDKLFGTPATTRNWNTITTLVKILKNRGEETG